jgi:hypothetical protein
VGCRRCKDGNHGGKRPCFAERASPAVTAGTNRSTEFVHGVLYNSNKTSTPDGLQKSSSLSNLAESTSSDRRFVKLIRRLFGELQFFSSEPLALVCDFSYNPFTDLLVKCSCVASAFKFFIAHINIEKLYGVHILGCSNRPFQLGWIKIRQMTKVVISYKGRTILNPFMFINATKSNTHNHVEPC